MGDHPVVIAVDMVDGSGAAGAFPGGDGASAPLEEIRWHILQHGDEVLAMFMRDTASDEG